MKNREICQRSKNAHFSPTSKTPIFLAYLYMWGDRKEQIRKVSAALVCVEILAGQ